MFRTLARWFRAAAAPSWQRPTAREKTRADKSNEPMRHQSELERHSLNSTVHRESCRSRRTVRAAVMADWAGAIAPCTRQMPLHAFRPARRLRLGTFGGRTRANRARSTRPRVRGRQRDGVEWGSSSRRVGPLDCRSRRDASGRGGPVRSAQRVSRAGLCKLMSTHQHNTCCVVGG